MLNCRSLGSFSSVGFRPGMQRFQRRDALAFLLVAFFIMVCGFNFFGFLISDYRSGCRRSRQLAACVVFDMPRFSWHNGMSIGPFLGRTLPLRLRHQPVVPDCDTWKSILRAERWGYIRLADRNRNVGAPP